MADTTERFIAEQQKRMRRSIRKEQTLARRRLDSLEDKLTVIADQIVDTVSHQLVTGIAEIKQQIADLKSRCQKSQRRLARRPGFSIDPVRSLS
jgi:septal ring factor EnvC (AmiA/AmiB activator)